ncbi:MAG TPA: hypothetical protein VL651_10915 [Bacteroidia bacterium]|nr:hypothetical protein [Bacteroidia bacterium]
MKTERNAEKNYLFAMIVISALVSYSFFSLWRSIFFPVSSDSFCWLLFSFLYSTAFIFISIYAMVRLYKRKLTLLLLSVLVLEVICAFVFLADIFREFVSQFRTFVFEHVMEKQTEISWNDEMIGEPALA